MTDDYGNAPTLVRAILWGAAAVASLVLAYTLPDVVGFVYTIWGAL